MKRFVFALAVMVGSGLAWAGCTQSTPAVVVRSLERSGRAAFLCIHAPGQANPGRELDSCFTPGVPPGRYDYRIPHVIALVTQMARGELALVDVTAETVLDVDKSVPGYNFLPIGAQPTDVVATPAGNAAFVGIGDPTRPGIFAIPSAKLPLMVDAKPPTYGVWPACALPPGGVPTEMVIVPDTTTSESEPGGRRAHCDGSPASPVPEGATDLVIETEMFGRLKLAVMLPELGAIDIVDAQDLLSREPGSFDPCVIERRVFLSVDADLPPALPPPDAGAADAARGDAAPSDGGELDASVADTGSVTDAADEPPGTPNDAGSDDPRCVPRCFPGPPPSQRSHPYALALSDDGRLFVSDDNASVIHVVDVRDPCGSTEKAPLLAYSAADPLRAVVSGAIAVSPLTSDGKRYVYASDVKHNGSLMVFDVSDTSTERRPLLRQDRAYNPFEPPDRVLLPAPIESMTFATHEIPLAKPNPDTGVIPRGIPCDPANLDDPNRPPDDFLSAGAGPRRLRGTFAFLVLSNGDMNVFDLDDFDEQCRRPRYTDDTAFGCDEKTTIPADTGLQSASQEVSCNVVERHRPRSMNFFTNVEKAGRHAPAMTTFPVLYDKDGTSLSSDPSRPGATLLPRLLGPQLTEAQDPDAWPLLATVLSSTAIPGNGLLWEPIRDQAQANWVTFDLRQPRAHLTQAWTVTYEGVLPWFAARRGRFLCADKARSPVECELGDAPSHLELHDSSVSFCDGGAQGEDMAPAGDILEIVDNLPDATDPYWATAQLCSRAECEEVFGTLAAPRVLDSGRPIGRDIVIQKSYQDLLSLKASVALTVNRPIPVACCFPYPTAYTVRGGDQWIVTGQATGFQHRLFPDKDTKACVESDDPILALRNGRYVARLPADPVLSYDDPAVFRNAQLRFVIWDMEGTACAEPPCAGRVRDRFFSFQEAGGFVPMRFGLSSSQFVMPQSVRHVRGIQKLAIPDPLANGLMLFSLNRLATTNLFF